MASIDVPLTKRGFGKTARKDLWWVQPLLTFLGIYLSSYTPPGRAFRAIIISAPRPAAAPITCLPCIHRCC